MNNPLSPPAGVALCELEENSGRDFPEANRSQDSKIGASDVLNLLQVNKFDCFARSRFGFDAYLKEKYSEVLPGHKQSLWDRYNVCGHTGIKFACGSCDKERFIPKSCGVRGCEICGKYQYGKLSKRYGVALSRLPQHNLRKVELTWGHIPITKEGLNGAYTKACKVLSFFWPSWVAGLEVSPSGSGHLHSITVGRYVGQAELSAKAEEILGCPVVWISRPEKLAVKYLIKDVAKAPAFKSVDMRIRYFEATRGLRMFRTHGVDLYGLGEEVKAGCLFCDDCGGVMQWVGECDSPVYDGRTPPPVADWVRDMELSAGCS